MEMPRKARKISQSGIYHVMIRGINRQDLFESDEDRAQFLEIIDLCKTISAFELFAFCLMSNHVHLLIRIMDEPLDAVIKRIGVRYVQWYNKKYDRTGHLFQDRYKSENVEDNQYLLTVLRYIIQNPMKAGLEDEPGSYPWTSYQAYCEGRGKVTDTKYISEMFPSREVLIPFLKEPVKERVLDFTDRISDEDAKALMSRLTSCRTVAEFQAQKGTKQREDVLELLRSGLSPKQITRLTGKSLAMIYRCKNTGG